MSDTYHFPGSGYEVTVYKKQDIVKTIEENITDKEVALALIEQCEFDASNFLRQGKWTGIPFIGNIRIPKTKILESTSEQQALIETAKENLNNTEYIMFRRQLGKENAKLAKLERYYKYIISITINHNKALFKSVCKRTNEKYARIFMYTVYFIASANYEYEVVNDED